MRPRVMALAAAVTLLVLAPTLRAYLRFGTQVGNQVVGTQWRQFPIKYSITNRDVPGVTASQLQAAVAQGFATWDGPDNVAISSQFLGLTGLDPVDDDNTTVIGFKARPDLERTLGETTFTLDASGSIIESDIFLNTSFSWSVAPNGEANRFDVQSIVTHELGHFLGLGHSALGETQLIPGGRKVLGKGAVMFPIAYAPGTTLDRKLQADDIAGITEVYGGPAAAADLGAIQGRVTLNNAGVYGAHVTAFNPSTGDLVSGYTLTKNGDFVIASLKPGQYIVRVEPLDDIDLDSVFDPDEVININFQVGYYSRPVSVPAGGAGASIVITVKSK